MELLKLILKEKLIVCEMESSGLEPSGSIELGKHFDRLIYFLP